MAGRLGTRRGRVLSALALALAVTGVATWRLTASSGSQTTAPRAPEGQVRATPPPTPSVRPRAVRRRAPKRAQAPPPLPSAPRIEIPAIGVKAHVIDLGLKPDGKLEVPRNYAEAGWWSRGARPGLPGAAVVVGHVDSRSGPAVFYRLHELEAGDRVRFVHADGSTANFVVDHKQRHSKNAFPTRAVYDRTPTPTLRLVTCAGSFDSGTGHYRDNLIVFANAA